MTNKEVQKHSSKALLPVLLCIILVCVTNVGSTQSYYAAKIGNMDNVFTFSMNIRADLIEPNWNPDEGIKIVPGKRVSKDPMITNTCKIPEYAAIMLTFQYKDKATVLIESDYNRLMNLIVIDWNIGTGEKQWTAVSGAGSQTQIYVYNSQIDGGEISAPIFNTIRLKTKADGLTEAELRWLQGIKIVNGSIVPDDSGLGVFNIKVEGAVVQADAFNNSSDASATLTSLFS